MARKLWCLVLLLPAAVAGCNRGKTHSEDPRPPEVQVSAPVKDRIVNYEVFIGRTQAVNRVELRTRVSGYLDRIYVGREDETQDGERLPIREGGDVKKGQVLFVIQEKPFRDALTQAEKTLEL